MSDPIIEAVERRWKRTAATSWYDGAQKLDAEDAISSLKYDVRIVKSYKAKCVYIAQIFRNLAGPLETPKIAQYADLIDQRIQDVDQLMSILRGGDQLIAKATKEFDQLIEDLATGKKLTGGYIEAIYDLPSMTATLKMANKANEIQSRLHIEDNEAEIDWTLEEYLGGEAKIYHKLENNGGPLNAWFAGGSEFMGVWALYGFLKYHLDGKYIEDLVGTARAKRNKVP
jgi:hypothetical protein